VTGSRRELANEKLRNFYFSPNIVNMVKQRNCLSRAWERSEKYTQFWSEKTEEERPVVRPRCGWDIKMDIKEMW
jgi:hypothetical protein